MSGVDKERFDSNSIQSITLDFTGLNYDNEPTALELSMAPAVSDIDLATYTLDTNILDLNFNGLDDSWYNIEYNLLENDDEFLAPPFYRQIGNLGITGNAYENDNPTQKIYGHVWNEEDLYGGVESRLSRIVVGGNRDGSWAR